MKEKHFEISNVFWYQCYGVFNNCHIWPIKLIYGALTCMLPSRGGRLVDAIGDKFLAEF